MTSPTTQNPYAEPISYGFGEVNALDTSVNNYDFWNEIQPTNWSSDLNLENYVS